MIEGEMFIILFVANIGIMFFALPFFTKIHNNAAVELFIAREAVRTWYLV